MRIYLDTFSTHAGAVDESICLHCWELTFSPIAYRRHPSACGGCHCTAPPLDLARGQFAFAALLWFPRVARPLRSFGYVRAYVDEATPTAWFVPYGAPPIALPLLAVVWDLSQSDLAYTPRGWDWSVLPASVRAYLRRHPNYGEVEATAMAVCTVEEPGYAMVDTGGTA